MDNKLSTIVATAVGLGAIIGAGVFVLSGTAIALAGSGAIFAFIIVGIVALFVALQMGELGSILPNSKGAAYSYVYRAFGSQMGFITGILLYFSYATAISAISLGFGSYFSSILGLDPNQYGTYFAIMIIAILAVINLFGVRKAAKFDTILVILKVCILLIFIGFAFSTISKLGNFNTSNFYSTASQQGIGPIFAASVVIFFAYSGFQVISTLTSRIKGGAKSAAKALVGSVLISMVIYVLIGISLIILVPVYKYTITADPLSFALQSANAPQYLFILVSIGALIATASATLAMILSASRTVYQISVDRLLPKQLRLHNNKTDVATNGVILSCLIGVAMLFSGNIYVIAAISNFGLVFSYIMTSFALMHFRRIKMNATFRTPFYPYVPIITIVALFAFMLGMPQIALVIGVIIIIFLIVVYYFLREIESKKVVRIRLFQ